MEYPLLNVTSSFPCNAPFLHPPTSTRGGGRWDHSDWVIVLIYRADILHSAAEFTAYVRACTLDKVLRAIRPSYPKWKPRWNMQTSFCAALWFHYLSVCADWRVSRAVIGQHSCHLSMRLCCWREICVRFHFYSTEWRVQQSPPPLSCFMFEDIVLVAEATSCCGSITSTLS